VDGVIRLNTDGTLDMDFVREVRRKSFNGFTASGDNHSDTDLVFSKSLIQPDGKIVVGGEFISYDEAATVYPTRVARFLSSGTLDMEFIKNASKVNIRSDVNSIALQSDGKIILGSNDPFVRLNSDGTPDHAFIAVAGESVAGGIGALLLMPDDKIIIGGFFNSYSDIKVGNIVRISSEGRLDDSFVQSPSRQE
jgi:uncharacterized delta-60 repeat protein